MTEANLRPSWPSYQSHNMYYLHKLGTVCIPQYSTALSTPLKNHHHHLYREDPQLYIDGSTLYSKKGTTQGYPLAMAMYAIAITL